MHSTVASAGFFAELGGIVTVIYTAQSEAPVKKSGFSLLPVLVVLFIISYAILTLLVVEQGRTIESQRGMLRELLKDSTELAGLKVKIAQERAAARKNDPAPQAQSKGPNAGPKSNDDQLQPVPPDSGKNAKPRSKSHATKEVPQTPASDLQDVRRAKQVI